MRYLITRNYWIWLIVIIMLLPITIIIENFKLIKEIIHELKYLNKDTWEQQKQIAESKKQRMNKEK